MCWIRQQGNCLRESGGGRGGGDVVNTLRWGGIEKRGKKVRILKRGAKLVHGVGP